MGRMISANRAGTCRGSNFVPKVSPSEAVVMQASGIIVSRIAQWIVR
jgi:hypothetical protein